MTNFNRKMLENFQATYLQKNIFIAVLASYLFSIDLVTFVLQKPVLKINKSSLAGNTQVHTSQLETALTDLELQRELLEARKTSSESRVTKEAI